MFASPEAIRNSPLVLLIDDEADIRDVAQLTLDVTMGWQTVVAPGGEPGLVIARHDRPDAILLDIMMPGLDGFATLERLRADPATQDIPVVFLSAKESPDLLTRIEESGAVGLVPKPFNALTLGTEVAALLKW